VVKAVAGWGDAFDPKGDCQLELSDGQLTIKVPGTPHGLTVQNGDLSSPRILRPVNGDFVATVRVAGTFHPGGKSQSASYLPYDGAGLLLWQDSNNYLRFERAAIMSDGTLRPYMNYERWQGGSQVSSRGTPYPDEPVVLRIERKGNQILASFSPDGKRWISLPTIDVKLSPDLRVGVSATINSTVPFSPELSEFQVTGPNVKDPEKAPAPAKDAQ
jgi:regulation of enolase protein 1 (concanavalin A-like superfamily)